ncbi:hypothetical protein [Streptomyces sp. NPDC021212]|uniref:hypothetical protein n=1 Tax=Streptomyces sp. NPDC021212 TaxID=3365118 RepID=UPI0037B7629A
MLESHDAARLTPRTGLAEAWRQPTTPLGLWLMFTVHFPVQVFVLLWAYPFLTQGQGLSETTASYVTAIPLVVTMVLGPVFGLISGRRPGWRLPMVLGIAFTTALTWAMVLLWPAPRVPLPVLFLLATVLGLGNPAAVFGLDIARTGSPPHRVGVASGIANIGGYTAALSAMLLIGVGSRPHPRALRHTQLRGLPHRAGRPVRAPVSGAGLLLRHTHHTTPSTTSTARGPGILDTARSVDCGRWRR